MKAEKIIDEGINGLGIGVINTNAEDFKALQTAIQEHAATQSPEAILRNKMLGLRFQMETYLQTEVKEVKEVGFFLKQFLSELNIRNKTFAKYIGYQESNLSALFKGRRKINTDLALKLGKIFRVAPSLWINIQSKNELIRLEKENSAMYQKYKVEDLLS
ncbi:MAG: HigA family addiction module antitoxin [Bacteroidota bacterium]